MDWRTSDRVNYAYGVAGGLADTIKMSSATASLVLALFFVGYTTFQIPGASYAAKHSAKKLVFWALLLWGGLCAAQGLVKTALMLAVVRTLLGAVESVVFPAMLVFLTHWFTKRERSKANTLLILGNPLTMTTVSVISGFLIDYFDRAPRWRGCRSWQMMFVLEGIPSILWAGVWWFMADDRPSDAKWLDGARSGGGRAASGGGAAWNPPRFAITRRRSRRYSGNSAFGDVFRMEHRNVRSSCSGFPRR